MAILINSDNYTDEELGATLYQALSLSVENPEPWYLLTEDEKLYYCAAARDFIRYLQRNEGRRKATSTQRLWTFDFETNKAKTIKATCENAKDPLTWVAREGRRKVVYRLGETVFETKAQALRYGWDQTQKSLEKGLTVMERLSREIEALEKEDEREDDNGEGMDAVVEGCGNEPRCVQGVRDLHAES